MIGKPPVNVMSSAPANPVIDAAASAMADLLDSFYSLEKQKDAVLKGNTKPAQISITSPAYGRSNARATALATTAASDHALPSPRFEALQVKFSDKAQGIIAIPIAIYDEKQPDLYEVNWSRDGKQFRADLALALVPKQWGTPDGMIREVSVTMHRNMQPFGTFLYLDLRNSELRKDKKKTSGRKRGEQKQAAEKQKVEKPEETVRKVGAAPPAETIIEKDA